MRHTAPPDLRRPLAFAIACFVVWGLAYGLLDVLNKHFQESLHVGKAQSTWLQTAYFGAYLTVSVPAGMILQARGYRFGIVFGLLITAIGALCFIPAAGAASFPAFVGAMFILAAGLCCLETAADTYVNVLGPAEGASRRLNLAQSFNALGVFVGPLIGGALFFGGGKGEGAVQATYVVIAGCVLAFAALVARTDLPELSEPSHVDAGTIQLERGATLKQAHFVFGVVTQALYVGAQVGIGALFINLATETWPGLTSRGGAFLLSIAAGAYLVGRFVTTGILVRFRPNSVLTLYGLANVLLCGIVACGLPRISALALVGVFFFMSTMFATIFTLGVARLGAATKRGASLMVTAIGGGMVLPYPMGRIADAYGSPAAVLLPAMCFACVALYGWRGWRV